MPDTFAHIGVQALASRSLLRDADIKWIAVGCIIPDVPWIVQRIVLALQAPVDPYGLRFYAIAQASLFCCLLLAGAIALLVADSRRLFLLLALNVFLHLFLDALQTKWANGVHFLAPFSWRATSFGLFWPEDSVSRLLTLLGVLALLYFGFRDRNRQIVFSVPPPRPAAVFLLLAAYLALPALFSYGPRQEDNHYTDTLSRIDKRPGRYVELDRLPYSRQDNSIRLPSGERVRLEGETALADGLVSVQGRFTDVKTIHVSNLHVHTTLRDLSSKVALAGVLLLWLLAFARKRSTFQQPSSS
jgi:hypothetical protein